MRDASIGALAAAASCLRRCCQALRAWRPGAAWSRAAGWVGACFAGETARRGHLGKCGRPLSATQSRRAEESCREPAESRPSRPDSGTREPAKQTPAHPAAREAATRAKRQDETRQDASATEAPPKNEGPAPA